MTRNTINDSCNSRSCHRQTAPRSVQLQHHNREALAALRLVSRSVYRTRSRCRPALRQNICTQRTIPDKCRKALCSSTGSPARPLRFCHRRCRTSPPRKVNTYTLTLAMGRRNRSERKIFGATGRKSKRHSTELHVVVGINFRHPSSTQSRPSFAVVPGSSSLNTMPAKRSRLTPVQEHSLPGMTTS